MKKYTYLLIILAATILVNVAKAQDITSIQVDLPDNPRLQWNNLAVKQRAIVLIWQPLINGAKDFYIKVNIQNWSNNTGTYGSLITTLLQVDGTLSAEQKARLIIVYGDWISEHQSTGIWCDNSTGAITTQFQQDGVTPTSNAVPEAAYWQQFKLNQVSGMGSISTQGAFDSEYKIIQAVVAKMSTRKNW